MPIVRFLPHPQLCPEGVEVEAKEGEVLLDVALDHGIDLEHACERACACTTCHVIVREGYNSLTPAEEAEEDRLDTAWGLTSQSRLGCQACVGARDLVIELPKYTINLVSEKK